jgi:DNA-binding NarL/FixJ family response regulator
MGMIDIEEARISGRSASSPTELSPSEFRVAELAAEGMRNSDIARTLYLSTKTVETHLGKAYRKLGISNRAQLVRALK